MKRLLVAAIAAFTVFAAAPARAQTTTTVRTFTTVDSVQASYNNGSLTIRGVLSGDAGPTDTVVSFYSSTLPSVEACQRMALLAMDKPGFYVLTVSWITVGYPTCKLARAVP